jgi:pSer/pThr/pTyr-binding forkhead associated (FHA) protein
METNASKFIISREDLNVDPVALVADGLKIGRVPSCELVLNHPMVSRLHAGINEADGRFYLYNFSHSSGTTLNGRVVAIEEAEVLADGDIIQIGPYFLHVARLTDALSITVTLEVALNVGEAESRGEVPQAQTQSQAHAAAGAGDKTELSAALSVFWEKRKREAGKVQHVSPLRPQKAARVLGKARFNWTPTRDLVRPWPFSVFIWGFALVAILSVVAAVVYASSYAPAPVSAPHARTAIQSQPPIALHANAGSCTACHALRTSMDKNCASCHDAPSFKPTVTAEHHSAGIGCTDCHVEHQGTEFRPAVASITTCTNCHNGSNKKTYNGLSVGTPHGGTFGYPVSGGKWVWQGLTDEEWQQKSDEVQKIVANIKSRNLLVPEGSTRDADDIRRSAEFHALHVHRVKAIGGLPSNAQGEMSCSSCHKYFAPVNPDRDTPKTTCGVCHNGNTGDQGGKFENVFANAPDKPNCISCHVQHPLARREWGRSLLNDLTAKSPDFTTTDASQQK